MFHLELRQFPHVARAFNLTREELDRRFARPWVSGREVRHEDRSWSPPKATLTIYEGPELGLGEIGLGRGWANVGRSSQEVTETVLAEAQRGAEGRSTVEVIKAAIVAAARTPVGFPEVVALIVAEYPRWRASEQLALAEQAVWELLHQRQLVVRDAEEEVIAERWPAILLDWSTWTGAGGPELVLESTA
ncbi:MAG: hypothetical protein M3016_03890 [Actinomycetota bacterium]|nr:hypothetical protein [Actinomycetota bacterium]